MRTVYKVYEISPECRDFGKLLKTYFAKKSADKFAEKSIYRYVKEDKVLVVTIFI